VHCRPSFTPTTAKYAVKGYKVSGQRPGYAVSGASTASGKHTMWMLTCRRHGSEAKPGGKKNMAAGMLHVRLGAHAAPPPCPAVAARIRHPPQHAPRGPALPQHTERSRQLTVELAS
jgi:hypothetical protein